MNFCDFGLRDTFIRANYTKITRDRPEQLSYKIISIKCRFQRSKSRLPTFKEVSARRHQTGGASSNARFRPVKR